MSVLVCTTRAGSASTTTTAASAPLSYELGLFEEIDESRRVDDGEIDVAAIAMGKAGGRRLGVRYVFRFVVGDRGTVGDRASTRDSTAACEHGLHERGLARVMRAHKSNVALTLDVHGHSPYA